tara:strand:- start:1263 stop:2126 length:864 start_codon:yes stop_codon:yes gene_type:complete
MDNDSNSIMAFNRHSPLIPGIFEVKSKSKETHDTWSIVLNNKEPCRVETFNPGQFNMLYAYGTGEIPISISGDCSNQKYIVHTIRDVGKVSHALCNLKSGDQVGVRGPFGTTWPMDQLKGKDVVIIGGGIGLAPIRPVIFHILENRDDYNRVAIAYGARAPEEMLYPTQIMDWRSHLDMQVRVTVDSASPKWHGQVGVVTTLIPRLNFNPDNTAALVCGPEIMIRFAVKELISNGINPDEIWVSMERNMKCGIGLSGHCQMGSMFVCKDGPVFNYMDVERYFRIKEL